MEDKFDPASLDAFIKSQPKKTRSMFDPYQDEILYMRKKDLTLEAIVEYLKQKDDAIAQKDNKSLISNLSRYLDRVKRKKNKSSKGGERKQEPKQDEEKETTLSAKEQLEKYFTKKDTKK